MVSEPVKAVSDAMAVSTYGREREGNFCGRENGSYEEQIPPIATATARPRSWLPLPRLLEADKTGRGPDDDATANSDSALDLLKNDLGRETSRFHFAQSA